MIELSYVEKKNNLQRCLNQIFESSIHPDILFIWEIILHSRPQRYEAYQAPIGSRQKQIPVPTQRHPRTYEQETQIHSLSLHQFQSQDTQEIKGRLSKGLNPTDCRIPKELWVPSSEAMEPIPKVFSMTQSGIEPTTLYYSATGLVEHAISTWKGLGGNQTQDLPAVRPLSIQWSKREKKQQKERRHHWKDSSNTIMLFMTLGSLNKRVTAGYFAQLTLKVKVSLKTGLRVFLWTLVSNFFFLSGSTKTLT